MFLQFLWFHSFEDCTKHCIYKISYLGGIHINRGMLKIAPGLVISPFESDCVIADETGCSLYS